MFQAVIFDVDGTLLDTEQIYIKAWKLAGLERGYSISDSLMKRTRGIAANQSQQIMLDELGDDFPYTEILARKTEISEACIAKEEHLLKPGAIELLHKLREWNIPFALATSTVKKYTQAHLNTAGIAKLVNICVTSDMVARSKPYPDVFLQAAKLLNIMNEACLVVEDSLAGLLAAEAAGMKAIWIPDTSSNISPREAKYYRKYSALNELLKELPMLCKKTK